MTISHILSKLFLISCLGLVLASPAQAASHGLATQFYWEAAWGTIDIGSPPVPDPIIPAAQFNVKNDIKTAVQLCGLPGKPYSDIESYVIDLTGDGFPDYIDGADGFFSSGVKPTCPLNLCDGAGCNISIYSHETTSQIMTAIPGGAPACPATAALNTTCRTDCAATTTNCPALFNYHSVPLWDNHVYNWAVISPASFASVRASHLYPDGVTPKYRVAFNTNPILQTQMVPNRCTLEEMDVDNNGLITTAEPCIKYYQYRGGSFIDLYAPAPLPSASVPTGDSIYTTVAFSTTVAKVDSATRSEWRRAANNAGVNNLNLPAGGFISMQIENYSVPGSPVVPLVCREYRNTSANKYFIPTLTDLEIEKMNQVVVAGRLSGVTMAQCERRFTGWVGETTCPALACDESRAIAAARDCQRSSSGLAACAECDAAVGDPAPLYADPSNMGDPANKCFFSRICFGPPCPPVGGGGDCLPAETKILMADGSEKAIESIMLGDMVMGYSKDAPLDMLKAVKVVSKHTTDRKGLIQINEMKISREHLVLHDNGKFDEAKKLRVGDMLVGISGQPIKIEKIQTLNGEDGVYNLSVEGADGFVADGIRVAVVTKVGK